MQKHCDAADRFIAEEDVNVGKQLKHWFLEEGTKEWRRQIEGIRPIVGRCKSCNVQHHKRTNGQRKALNTKTIK